MLFNIMVFFVCLLLSLAASQDRVIQVSYPGETLNFRYSDLDIKYLQRVFNTTRISYLEDLSGKTAVFALTANHKHTRIQGLFSI